MMEEERLEQWKADTLASIEKCIDEENIRSGIAHEMKLPNSDWVTSYRTQLAIAKLLLEIMIDRFGATEYQEALAAVDELTGEASRITDSEVDEAQRERLIKSLAQVKELYIK
jgi:hypothetical protein